MPGPAGPPAAVDPVVFRRTIGRFATGVTVVTTVHRSVHHAATVNSFTSVSLDPLLVLCCIDRTARLHDPLVASGRWAVSVLGADQEHASRWFATRGRPEEQQLDGYRTTVGPVTGAAVFVNAIAAVECRTWASYPGGDHTIFVGEVLRLMTPPARYGPLVYYDGGYTTLPPPYRR